MLRLLVWLALCRGKTNCFKTQRLLSVDFKYLLSSVRMDSVRVEDGSAAVGNSGTVGLCDRGSDVGSASLEVPASHASDVADSPRQQERVRVYTDEFNGESRRPNDVAVSTLEDTPGARSDCSSASAHDRSHILRPRSLNVTLGLNHAAAAICKKGSFRYSTGMSLGGRLRTVEEVNPSGPSAESHHADSSDATPLQTVSRRKGLPNLHARIVPADVLVTRRPPASVVFKYQF